MDMNIGPTIKRLRRQKDMTQEQLAQLLCVSSAAVSKWEAGNTYPDITMLFPLAQIFSVSIDELMGYDKESTQAEMDCWRKPKSSSQKPARNTPMTTAL